MTYAEFIKCNNKNKAHIKERGLVTIYIENPQKAVSSGVITAVKFGTVFVSNPEVLEPDWNLWASFARDTTGV